MLGLLLGGLPTSEGSQLTKVCQERVELSRIMMKERSPQFSCRNHRVLICLTLVSLFMMTTLGSTPPSSVLPGKMTPSNFSSSSQSTNPPTTATFQMECFSPGGYIWDICWLDDNTMVWVHYAQSKVLKVSVNRQSKTCTYIELESPRGPSRVACSPDGGEIYVTHYGGESVWVYDRNSVKAVWKPEGLVGKAWSVAMNRERIVVSPYSVGHLYEYDRNRVYQGKIIILENQFAFYYSHLTEEGLFVASTGNDDHRLIIHDLVLDSTVTIGGLGSEDGQFHNPSGVSSVGDYILVSDGENHRVPVFSKNVEFHGNLQFKGTNMQRPFSQAYRSKTNLLAIKTNTADYNNVKFFSLT